MRYTVSALVLLLPLAAAAEEAVPLNLSPPQAWTATASTPQLSVSAADAVPHTPLAATDERGSQDRCIELGWCRRDRLAPAPEWAKFLSATARFGVVTIEKGVARD